MVKYRPVISVSRKRNDGEPLCTVVPISSTAPGIIRDHHYLLPQDELPHHLRDKYPEAWVKVDMVATVAFRRLNLLWHGRDAYGNRVYQTGKISLEHREEISRRVAAHFVLEGLDVNPR
jgi:uncharacterized protein YifN (PemK superfamily)